MVHDKIGSLTPLPQQRVLAGLSGSTLVVAEPMAGSTTALIMAACAHMHVPGSSAIVFAATEPDVLGLERGVRHLLQGAYVSLAPSRRTWVFRGGATLTLAAQSKHSDYQGAEFSLVGFHQLHEVDQCFVRCLAARARLRTRWSPPVTGWRAPLVRLGLLGRPAAEVRPRVCAVVPVVQETAVGWAADLFENRIEMRTADNVHADEHALRLLHVSGLIPGTADATVWRKRALAVEK
jgi:hypothetical protein